MSLWDPQCGSNGKTYGNSCELKRAACQDETIILAYPGECSGGRSSTNAGKLSGI